MMDQDFFEIILQLKNILSPKEFAVQLQKQQYKEAVEDYQVVWCTDYIWLGLQG